MGMSGKKITGYKFVGMPILSTLGQLIFWYDWRYNNDSIVQSGRTKVLSWRSLEAKGTPLNIPNSVYLCVNSGAGFGYISTDPGSPRNRGILYPELNIMHNGTAPWLYASVFRGDYTSGSTSSVSTLLSTAGSATKPGITIQLLSYGTPRIRVQIVDAANSVIVNWSTPVSTVPLGRNIPVAIFYYGDTAANNYKMYIEGTAYTFSAGSPTYSTASPNQFNVGGIVIAANDFSMKLHVLYNLTGKNRTQVDSFVTNFFTVLKSDAEYSALITP